MTASPASLAPVVAQLAEIAIAAKLGSATAAGDGSPASGFADALRTASLKHESAGATTAAQATADVVTDAAAIAGLVMPWIIPLVPVIAAGANAVATAADAIADEVAQRPPPGSGTRFACDRPIFTLSGAMVAEREHSTGVESVGIVPNGIATQARASMDTVDPVGPITETTTPLIPADLLDEMAADDPAKPAVMATGHAAMLAGLRGATTSPTVLSSAEHMISVAGSGKAGSDTIDQLATDSGVNGSSAYSPAELATQSAPTGSFPGPKSDTSNVVDRTPGPSGPGRRAIESDHGSSGIQRASIPPFAPTVERPTFARHASTAVPSIDREDPGAKVGPEAKSTVLLAVDAAMLGGSKGVITGSAVRSSAERASFKGFVGDAMEADAGIRAKVTALRSRDPMVIEGADAQPQTRFPIAASNAGDGMAASDAIDQMGADPGVKGSSASLAAELAIRGAPAGSLPRPASDPSTAVSLRSVPDVAERRADESRQDSRGIHEASIPPTPLTMEHEAVAPLASTVVVGVDRDGNRRASFEATAAVTLAEGAAPTTPAARELGMPVPAVDTQVAAPGWHEAFAQRLAEFVSVRAGDAEIRLNPANLGPVGVEISYKGNEASVLITAAQPATRDALEQALPHLRELLAQQGIALGQANVRDPGSGNAWASAAAAAGPDRAARAKREAIPAVPLTTARPNLLVDTFA